MNTDRELLELAAKAAGYTIAFCDAGVVRLDTSCNEMWNPRHNDGDAFRLAIRLGISLDLCDWSQTAFYGVDKFIQEDWSNGGDPCDAARLAILRAAAEIGRDMK